MIFHIYVNNINYELTETKNGWEVDKEICTPDGEEHLLNIFINEYPNHKDIIRQKLSLCWEKANLGSGSESQIQEEIDEFIAILDKNYK